MYQYLELGVLVVFLTLNGIDSLKNLMFHTPNAILVGDTLRMNCTYDLQDELLYSIKWYLNDQEFYRYVPKESPPTRVFPLLSIMVDLSQSDEFRVVLTDMKENHTGYYKCEVSADAPSFHTDIRTELVIIAVPPETVPILFTNKTKYATGENITVNCTVPKVFPTADLTWYINEEKVNASLCETNSISGQDFTSFNVSLETVKSQLQLSILPNYFKNNKMTIKCTATMYGVYSESSEMSIEDNSPQLARVLSPYSTLSYDDSTRLNVNKIALVNLILTTMLMLN